MSICLRNLYRKLYNGVYSITIRNQTTQIENKLKFNRHTAVHNLKQVLYNYLYIPHIFLINKYIIIDRTCIKY